jgi:hypothetical protein
MEPAAFFLACMVSLTLSAQQSVPLGPSSPSPAPPTPPAGAALVAQGKLAEALPLLDTETAQSPGDPKLALVRVRCLFGLARWNEALDAARPLLEKFPADPEIRILVGDLLLSTFHAQEAVETWRPLLTDPIEGERALEKVLGALLAQRKFGEARAILNEGRARRAVLSDASLRFAINVSACAERLSLLETLALRHDDAPAMREELRVERQVCEHGGETTVLPSGYPDVVRATPDGMALKIRLDGRRDVWMALDTGADALLLDANLAKKLDLTELGRAEVKGIGSRDPRARSLALLPDFEAGNLRVTNALALLSFFPSQGAYERAGIVGLGPFLGCIADWDRRKSRLTLWPEGTLPEGILGKAADAVLPVLWARSIPIVQVRIDGKGPFPFLFDTGAAFSLVSAQFAGVLGLHANSGKFQPGVGSGASGLFHADYAEEVRLSLGARDEAFPWIRLAEVPQRFPLPVFGILGMDVLSGYRVVFDGPRSSILLTRYSGGRYRDPSLKRLNPSPRRALIPEYIPPP